MSRLATSCQAIAMGKSAAVCVLLVALMAFAVQESESTVLATKAAILNRIIGHHHKPLPKVEKKVYIKGTGAPTVEAKPVKVHPVVEVTHEYYPKPIAGDVVEHVVDTAADIVNLAVDAATGKLAHVANAAHAVGGHVKGVVSGGADHISDTVHKVVDHVHGY